MATFNKYKLTLSHSADTYGIEVQDTVADKYKLSLLHEADTYNTEVQEIKGDDYSLILSLGTIINGDAAGFGTVDAEVDEFTGTPSVSVQTSGPNTAKNIHFSFRNLRGEGIPAGGTTGQVLVKQSNGNYDTAWTDAGNGVLFVQYGISTYADIAAAYNANKIVICQYGRLQLRLTSLNYSYANFAVVQAAPDVYGYYARCSSNSTWTNGIFNAADCYYAAYGTDTYFNALYHANDLNQIVYSLYDNRVYILTNKGNSEDETLVFTCIDNNILRKLTLSTSSVWNNPTTTLQEELVSGENIKTIKGQSIVGSGDISLLEVFVVIMGTTTYSAILSNLVLREVTVVGWHRDTQNTIRYYRLSYWAGAGQPFIFTCIEGGVVYTATVNVQNEWTYSSMNIESTANRTTSLSASSTDTQYPSAKSVYDFIKSFADANGPNMPS